MKEDKLEKFIEDNHASFYDEVPPQDAWDSISGRINQTKGPRLVLRRYLRTAVAAVVLVAVTFAATRYFVLSEITHKGSGLFSVIIKQAEDFPVKEFNKPVNEKIIYKFSTDTIVKTDIRIAKKSNERAKTDPYTALEEINLYYTSQLYSRKNEIFSYASLPGEVNREINVEINQMDSIYKAVMKDLKDNMNNKEVIESLILQYRLKIEFLDNILNSVKESENTSAKNLKYEM